MGHNIEEEMFPFIMVLFWADILFLAVFQDKKEWNTFYCLNSKEKNHLILYTVQEAP